MDLAPYRVVIAVFGMDGCGACETYIPRLAERAKRHGWRFHVYEPKKPVPKNAIPILIYDAASPDPQVQELANRYAVSATPATIVLRRGPGSFKVEGGLDDAQIDHLLTIALEARSA